MPTPVGSSMPRPLNIAWNWAWVSKLLSMFESKFCSSNIRVKLIQMLRLVHRFFWLYSMCPRYWLLLWRLICHITQWNGSHRTLIARLRAPMPQTHQAMVPYPAASTIQMDQRIFVTLLYNRRNFLRWRLNSIKFRADHAPLRQALPHRWIKI